MFFSKKIKNISDLFFKKIVSCIAPGLPDVYTFFGTFFVCAKNPFAKATKNAVQILA